MRGSRRIYSVCAGNRQIESPELQGWTFYQQLVFGLDPELEQNWYVEAKGQ